MAISSSAVVVIVCKIVLTILVFSIGYYYERRKSIDSPCNIKQPKTIKKKSSNCFKSAVYDHCVRKYGLENTHLHMYSSNNVAQELFPSLHHPTSPAKFAYILSGNLKWNSTSLLTSPCDNIYLTRTGQRANQPNKCVAVIRVPEGLPSYVQISHRIGITQLKTDQYMDDAFTQHSYQEESDLLGEMIRLMNQLKTDFIKQMGNPLVINNNNNSEYRRRTAIVMVANEGVMDLLLNFICSAEGAGIDLNNVMVFVGRESSKQLVESMGAHAMYSPALGSMVWYYIILTILLYINVNFIMFILYHNIYLVYIAE